MLLAAAPQLLDSPCCDVINRVPWGFFMVVHVALFALAILFALRMLHSDRQLLGLGFSLFALAEISYMTYHVNLTLFLFAHTVSEVLVGAALVAVFVAVAREGLSSSLVSAGAERPSSQKVVAR